MSELVVRTRLSAYGAPEGDEGWFGPSSVAWKVHADLGSMLVGGLSALFLQSLHPLVMQGVADHSGYREDPFGRLQRTAEFIAGTTYGPCQLAAALVKKVRAVHEQVNGTAPDGRSYSASDPQLLCYVHVSEVYSFLGSYQRYSGHRLLSREKDAYLTEMAVVAAELGAADVPLSLAEVRSYLRSVRPELAAGREAQRTIRFLSSVPPTFGKPEALYYRTLVEAAVDLLPPFARQLGGLYRPSALRAAVVRPAAVACTSALRFAIGPSPLVETSRGRLGR